MATWACIMCTWPMLNMNACGSTHCCECVVDGNVPALSSFWLLSSSSPWLYVYIYIYKCNVTTYIACACTHTHLACACAHTHTRGHTILQITVSLQAPGLLGESPEDQSSPTTIYINGMDTVPQRCHKLWPFWKVFDLQVLAGTVLVRSQRWHINCTGMHMYHTLHTVHSTYSLWLCPDRKRGNHHLEIFPTSPRFSRWWNSTRVAVYRRWLQCLKEVAQAEETWESLRRNGGYTGRKWWKWWGTSGRFTRIHQRDSLKPWRRCCRVKYCTWRPLPRKFYLFIWSQPSKKSREVLHQRADSRWCCPAGGSLKGP